MVGLTPEFAKRLQEMERKDRVRNGDTTRDESPQDLPHEQSIMGTLVGDLVAGGYAQLRIFRGAPGAEYDTGRRAKVYCKLLKSGKKFDAGSWCFCRLINARFQVDACENCPVSV